MAQAGAENFPVAICVLGAPAPAADGASTASRAWSTTSATRRRAIATALLDCDRGRARRDLRGATPEHPVHARPRADRRACELPDAPFRRLIEANRRDQTVDRYDDVRRSCSTTASSRRRRSASSSSTCSARRRPSRIALSDRICAGAAGDRAPPGRRRGLRARARVHAAARISSDSACEERELAAPGADAPSCAR